MKKSEAIQLLGGSVAAAAQMIGATYQAVAKWPEDLPRRIEDRVLAALYRKEMARPTPDLAPDVAAEGQGVDHV